MNYVELSQAIQNYAENTESLFVASIPTFVKETERRIYNSVQIPALRRNVTGVMTVNNKYISLPDDWLANYSLAVIDATGSYHFMLNKDVNFIRESYPNPNTLGLPKHYALFGSQINNTNELSLVMGPTPDSSYNMELHYFYYPVSIVQSVLTDIAITSPGTGYNNGSYFNVPLTGGSGAYATANIVVSGGGVTSITVADGGSLYVVGDVLTVNNSYIGGAGTLFSASAITVANTAGTSWLGDNYDPVLFYGAMREAVLFMKGEQDMVAYYEKMYTEAMSQLNRLGTGLERGDAYRDGQAKIKVNP
jgi:hypothetical protein